MINIFKITHQGWKANEWQEIMNSSLDCGDEVVIMLITLYPDNDQLKSNFFMYFMYT